MRGGNLPTVEDASVGSSGSRGSGGHNPSANNMQPMMKRSPYLSAMAGSSKESEDLVAMLSRPNPSKAQEQMPGMGGGLRRTSGGGSRGCGLAMGTPMEEGAVKVGRSTFFDLQRPSSGNPLSMPLIPPSGETTYQGSHAATTVSSAGGEFSDAENPKQESDYGGNNGDASDAAVSFGAREPSKAPVRSLQPSLRSALRVTSSRADDKPPFNAELKKNTSVTFSNTTKKASIMGIETGEQNNAGFNFGPDQLNGEQQQQQDDLQAQANLRQFNQQMQQQKQSGSYTAVMMMKKSQSIAAPQFMLAHQVSNTSSADGESSANASLGQAEGRSSSSDAGGNASFPIYFSKLPDEGQQQGVEGDEQQQATQGMPMNNPAPSKHPSTPNNSRQRSKSYNTLQYYYQNNQVQANAMDPAQKLLHASGFTGVAPISRPSINGLNLTFRDMLDEGDGAEGDLNLRLRNQQWKDFRSFSSRFEANNPMMAAAMMAEDGGCDDQPIKESGSMESSSTAATGATSDTPSTSLSGSKRTLTPSSLERQSFGGNKVFPPSRVNMPALAGSHRAAVSVNDLAMLRRAASRIKMNTPSSNLAGAAGGMGGDSLRRQSTQSRGSILGGDLLSRIESGSMGSRDVGRSVNDIGGDSSSNSSSMSPLAQMMAKSNAMRSSGSGAPAGSKDAQCDLFMQKFNMAVSGSGRIGGGGNPAAHNSPFGGGGGGMGRRVRTVGAGLAYGAANMSVDYKSGFRISKFDLGSLNKETSRLSEVSNTSSGGGHNEEWDLS